METRKLEDLNIKVNLINMNEDVERMINIAKTDRKNIFTTQAVDVVDAPTEKDLNELLF